MEIIFLSFIALCLVAKGEMSVPHLRFIKSETASVLHLLHFAAHPSRFIGWPCEKQGCLLI
nr:MAG TPA_asm: hypothetical protein [Caudoviricetes sp.]